MRVVVVGQGYVGLPLAMRAVEVGYSVVGFEPEARRLDQLAAGRSYVEDVSDAVIAEALKSGRYIPTGDPTSCSGFDTAIVAVPTPLRDGLPDTAAIRSSATMLGGHLRRGATVVLESTTYPGTTTELLVPILEATSNLRAGSDFHVGYSPERIDPGNQTWNLRNTPKIVSGIDRPSLEAVQGFYGQLVDEVVPVSTTAVAELVKLLENTFRHVNIALINELAMFAADMGVNVWEAITAASTKPFGFMAFTPGPGVGGHCLPIDPSYLSWKVKETVGLPFRFVELANDVNEHMPDYVARRVTATLNRERLAVNGSRILVLGLTYKRNSADARESPGLAICDRLAALGAEVRAADPHLDAAGFPSSAKGVDLSDTELAGCDLAVIVTDHDAFDWELVGRAAPRILDTRHRLLDLPNVEHL